MRLGTMDLNNLPGLNQSTVSLDPGTNAVASLGNKLVDALITNVAQGKGATLGGDNGLTIRDLVEVVKLLQPGDGQSAKDAGIGEFVKMFAIMMEQNQKAHDDTLKLLMETMGRKDEPKEKSKVEQMIEEVGFSVLTSGLNRNPRDDLKKDLSDLAELQRVIGSAIPQTTSIRDQAYLMKLQAQINDQAARTQLELERVRGEFALRKDEAEGVSELYETGFGVAKELLAQRRRTVRATMPSSRTAGSVKPPRIGMVRASCQACGMETLVNPNDPPIKFCPHCGDPKEPMVPNAVDRDPGEDVLPITEEEHEEEYGA